MKYNKKTCPKSDTWFADGGRCGWGHECAECSEYMSQCKECEGSGRTDNHVTGEVECSSCEGVGSVNTAGHMFQIEHIDGGWFRIWVTGPDGIDCYNGEWEQAGATIWDAMKEAMRGSGLS